MSTATGSAQKQVAVPFPDTEGSVTPHDAIQRHLIEMENWIAGRGSYWNTYARGPETRSDDLAACAVADAQEVVKHAAAVQAYAALLGSGYTVQEATGDPWDR